MSTGDWYEEAYERQDQVERTVAERFPELIDQAAGGSAPVVRIECPRGHQVARIMLSTDHNWRPILLYVEGSSRQVEYKSAERWRTASEATPGSRGQTVCPEPGCPNLWPCPDHAGHSDVLPPPAVGLRDKLKCPKCRWHEPHGVSDLLPRYAVAWELWRNTAGHLNTTTPVIRP